MAEHNTLTGSSLHECKGVASATSGQMQFANGSGSASFATPTLATTAPDVTATAAEINRATDVSGRLVSAGNTLSVTVTSHEGKTILLNSLTGSVCTLPAATGSGARFRFKVSVLATSNSHIVKVAGSSDIIQGIVGTIDTDTAGTITGFATAADSDTVTLNRSTTGSVMRGEYLEFEDIATNLWAINGMLSNTGAGATPFSATV
jgi:hypothetical protein